MKLFFRQIGNGESLLILHGFLGMSDNWITLGKRFSQYFNVILPDMRNHGKSFHSPEFGYEEMLDDILSLIENENLTKINIIGHSMGGKLAMFLALKYPNIVRRIIIVDIGPSETVDDKTINLLLGVVKQFNPKKCHSYQEVEHELMKLGVNNKLKQLLLKNIKIIPDKGLSWKFNADSLMQNFQKINQSIRFDGCFNREILFIKGEHSDYLNTSQWNEIVKMFPLAEMVEIKNAGHWVHADNSEDFYSEVIKFLIQ